MMRRTTIVLILMVSFVGTAVYLLAGVAWSSSSWSRGTFGFDMGWLLVAVVASRFVTLRWTQSDASRLRTWLTALLPAIPGFLGEAMADAYLHSFHHDPSRQKLLAFALFSLVLLFTALVCIVTFPYERILAANSDGHRKTSYATGFLLLAAVAIGTSILLANTLSGNEGPIIAPELQNSLVRLELWFFRCSLLVYVFLALRILFPIIETRIRSVASKS